MTAYRDRMNAGDYNPKQTDSAAKAQKTASTRAAKSTTAKPKRSNK